MAFRAKMIVLGLACCLTLTAPAPAGDGVGTSFAYQGEVHLEGARVTEDLDLRFRLYDAANGGVQLGTEVELLAVSVTDGRFTVDLDFGDQFGTDARWLEIDVRLSENGGAYATLAPRQEVKAAPVAQFALAGNEGPPGEQGPRGEQGPPGLLIDGAMDQTAYHDGAEWVATSNWQNDGGKVKAFNPDLPVGQALITANATFGRYGFEHKTGTVRLVSFAGTLGACWGTVSNDNLCFIQNNLVRLFIENTTGAVGIHTFGPQFTLHVNGTAGKPGGGPWAVASDRRLKRDIEPLENTLEKLLQLRGVSFEYKDPEAISELPGRQISMIAQEVETVFPGWVSEARDGYKRFAPKGFEALTVEALRDLRAEKDAEMEALREENRELRETNRLIVERLDELETRVR